MSAGSTGECDLLHGQPPSWNEDWRLCFAAHGRLLQRGPYAVAWQKYQANHDLEAYIRAIGEHYAIDPGYPRKIIQLAHGPHVYAAVIEARQAALDRKT